MDFLSFMQIMSMSNIPLLAAFFIGLMTAISPCPLATNITAIAYISKNFKNNKHTLLIGLTYTLGRMLTYIVIASLIVWFGLNVAGISFFLQSYGEKILGPMLIIIGIIMLGIIKLNFGNNDYFANIKEKLSKKGLMGSFLLGVLFALAFCPFSAVLFFGMLIPLAIQTGDALLLPSVFAIATGLPVIIFSIIIALGVSKLSKIMKNIAIFEKWVRYIAGSVFIIVGIYYTIIIWKVILW